MATRPDGRWEDARVGTRVAVAASSELATAAGVRLGESGGNAVDAALAAVLVAMVCEPGVCAPAGGLFVTVAPADGSPPVTVDGYVEMPGRGLPAERFGRSVHEVSTGYGGGLTTNVGHGSVATPGAFAGLDLANRNYGRAPWPEVVAPAAEAARVGFPLGSAAAYYLDFCREGVFDWHPDGRAVLRHPDGRLLEQGDIVHIPHLADSLDLLAAEGAAAFYTGDLARLVAADMAEHEGLLTAADLAAYRPIVRPALALRASDWRLATNPPPAIGGVAFAAMLALLGDRPRGDWTDDDVRHLVAVQDAVLRHRLDHLDVAPDRVAAAARLLDVALVGDLTKIGTAASTVHVSVVDEEGTACAITSSAGYGSGVMTPGTGIWLNNSLGEQELNRTGVHSLPPGERLASNMAPTVGRRDDGAAIAIGSPGADRITTALLQVLAGYVNGGLPLPASIERPRLHVRHTPDGSVIDHEEDLPLPALDLPTRALHPNAMYFGGVGAALREADGTLLAAGDPRRAAAVAVTPE